MPSEIITDKALIPWYRRPLVQIVWFVFLLPLWLILMWTGPSYYRKAGVYKKFGILAKVLLSIVGILLIVLALGQMAPEETNTPSRMGGGTPNTVPAPDTAVAPPSMQVEAVPGEITLDLSVTSDDDKPFTVQRVVVNDRVTEEGCDSTKMTGSIPLFAPARLKRGDTAAFHTACGTTILSARVYTDRGTVAFKFDSGSK
jgi:hypothetical protein